MASETSPLLRDANSATAYTNGGMDTGIQSYHSVPSIQETTSPRFYLGHDKRALFGIPPCGLSSVEAFRRLKTFGANEIEPIEASVLKRVWWLLLRPKAVLIWVAILLELVQYRVPSAVVLCFLQLALSCVAWLQQARTQSALRVLSEQRQSEVVVVRDGVHQTIDTSLLVPGDRISLSAGVVVSADCQLCESTSLVVDQGTLTGESLFVNLYPGDTVKQGSTIVRGDGDAIVVATRDQTFMAKYLERSVEGAGDSMPKIELASVRITVVLLVVVGAIAVICLSDLLFLREHTLQALTYVLTFTLIATPLSTAAVSKLVLALGARRLRDENVLVNKLDVLEQLASITVLCCDKTGTLTRNKLELQDDLPIFDPRGTREDVLVAAALAAKWKDPPSDAVDTLVLNAIDLRPLEQYTLIQHAPFDEVTKRAESVIRGPTGRVFKVSKGSPESILALVRNATDLHDAVEAKVMDLARRGVSCLAVARADDDGTGWVLLGILTYLDPPRHDSRRMIEKAHECGVAVKLVTGDQAAIAVETCRQLGMGMTVLDAATFAGRAPADVTGVVQDADGYAHALPAHKAWIVRKLKQHGWLCGVTGSTVADAAAMKTAYLSIAVESACEAVRRRADAVLYKPGLSVIVHGVLSARETLLRVSNFVKFQVLTTIHLAACLLFATLFFRVDACQFRHFATTSSHCGGEDDEIVEAAFNLPVTALAIFGLFRELMSVVVLHDTVGPIQQPHPWNMTRLVTLGLASGLVATGSSVLLLFWGLDSWQDGSLLASYGIDSLPMAQVVTVVFLQWTLMMIVSLAVSRDSSIQGIASRPAVGLCAVSIASAVLVSCIALFSPFEDMEPIRIKLVVFIWAYTILSAFVQFAVDVLVSRLLDELSRIGVLNGNKARWLFDRHEAHRLNRLRLGLSFHGEECTVRDSFVVGRPVRTDAAFGQPDFAKLSPQAGIGSL